jgi:SAM-dependent methyltransferase
VDVSVAPAHRLPIDDEAVDVVLLLEAVYYLPDLGAFLRECRRVLSPGGRLLLTTANRDLGDFNPSPLSHQYYGAGELRDLLSRHGFNVQLFGSAPVATLPWRHRVLRPAKAVAQWLGLAPQTMNGKAALRRLVFGRLPLMPFDLSEVSPRLERPIPVDGIPNHAHRFIYAIGTLDA